MSAFKRIFLLLVTNILILTMISIVLRLFGLDGYLEESGGVYGLNLNSLLIFCFAWGMGGAFISLWISKWMAKKMFRIQVIDANTPDATLRAVVLKVHDLAKSAGLRKMPEVGVYESPEVNAFATGATKNKSIVAVSRGLLHSMNKNEVDGVLGHEVAHIANGDMVTMTLVQGVVNAFVMFFARILAFAVSQAMTRGDERASPMLQFGMIIVFQILFSFLGMFVVAWFSRYREFRADAGSARLGGRPNMIQALKALQAHVGQVDKSQDQQAVATLKISSSASGLMKLLSTHPPLSERIKRLEMMRN